MASEGLRSAARRSANSRLPEFRRSRTILGSRFDEATQRPMHELGQQLVVLALQIDQDAPVLIRFSTGPTPAPLAWALHWS